MTKKKTLSLLIIIAVLVSFPIYSNLNEMPKKWTLKEFQNQELKWQNCYKNFQCSTLLVPVNYNKITSGVFHLKVIKFKATDQRQKLGALIVNPGGPGASAFDYAYNAENIVSAAIRDKYDIVGFDQRGVGQSDPIRCLTDKETDEMLAGPMIADTPENQRKMIKNAKLFASKCKKAAGNKLTHLSTFESAKDMELLRLALNEPKLNYLGKSYGTYLGTLYTSLYPLKVGKMILDGAIDPSISIQEQNLAQAKGFELALNQFLSENKISKIEIFNLFKKLLIKPLSTKSNRNLTDSLAILGVASALYDDVIGWPKLKKAINDASAGDGSKLLALADEYTGRTKTGKYFSNENDTATLISCLDWPSRNTIEQMRSASKLFRSRAPIFGSYLTYSQLVCNYLTTTKNAISINLDLIPTYPILIISVIRDPATPYEWGLTLSKKFPGSFFLTLDADGHTGQGRGFSCIDRAVDSFLITRNEHFPKVCNSK